MIVSFIHSNILHDYFNGVLEKTVPAPNVNEVLLTVVGGCNLESNTRFKSKNIQRFNCKYALVNGAWKPICYFYNRRSVH
jgi:hypothetical protein